MNWYIIFANDNKINDLLLYFNNHPEMTAFVPKIEKLMKKDGKIVDFNPSKIITSIENAADDIGISVTSRHNKQFKASFKGSKLY